MRRFPLLPRKKKSDKSDFGHVLVVAGSKTMTGAAILTARAALRSGAGLVTVASTRDVTTVITRALPECMHFTTASTQQGTIGRLAYKKIGDLIQKRKIGVLAVGPGLSQNPETAALVRRLVLELSFPMVLDADGLNSFRGRTNFLKKKRSTLVLTPHQREFERLFKTKLQEKLPARLRLAKTLSKFYDVVLVVKGCPTLVVGGGKVYTNLTGNPGMAKGGSGDVLTGIIAAFIAQGLKNFEAARWATFYHGRAADLAVKDKGELGLMATDIINYLPKAFSS